MSPEIYEFISLDLSPLLTALFAAISCALLGSFLLVRRQSLMGDSISHAVLPGIVFAFLFFGSRNPWPVFIGASIAGVCCAVLIELVQRYGRLEAGAAMGVVFSTFFAIGVLVMEQAAARSVDLDADCLLHGQLESIIWFPSKEPEQFYSLSTLSELPEPLWTSIAVLIGILLLLILLFKELTIASFDSELANTLGFSSKRINLILMLSVAAAVVASFQAVGSILVIGMLIVPAASARMYSDRLKMQLLLSSLFAIFAVFLGYFLATRVPGLLGYSKALSASGMMIVFAGVLFLLSFLFSHRYGLLARLLKFKDTGDEVSMSKTYSGGQK